MHKCTPEAGGLQPGVGECRRRAHASSASWRPTAAHTHTPGSPPAPALHAPAPRRSSRAAAAASLQPLAAQHTYPHPLHAQAAAAWTPALHLPVACCAQMPAPTDIPGCLLVPPAPCRQPPLLAAVALLQERRGDCNAVEKPPSVRAEIAYGSCNGDDRWAQSQRRRMVQQLLYTPKSWPHASRATTTQPSNSHANSSRRACRMQLGDASGRRAPRAAVSNGAAGAAGACGAPSIC